LCLGGLIKHVAGVEAGWLRFAVGRQEHRRDDSAEGPARPVVTPPARSRPRRRAWSSAIVPLP
ncbi:DUF664 domain-containing protein, partial [Kitasatospora indigofera]|uniref:mycothiol transferase n=1 Tax=Kitasatospora indigofera TaxID=67307 RepID=UPI00363FC1B0